jgi:hypothetical protein
MAHQTLYVPELANQLPSGLNLTEETFCLEFAFEISFDLFGSSQILFLTHFNTTAANPLTNDHLTLFDPHVFFYLTNFCFFDKNNY